MIDETSDSPFPTRGSVPGAGGSAAATGGMAGSAPSMAGATAGARLDAGFDDDAAQGTVRRMAQRAHEAVDRLEQTLGSGSERVMDWQQEYGEMAREQVRSNPLAAVGLAFVAGIVFNKLFMR